MKYSRYSLRYRVDEASKSIGIPEQGTTIGRSNDCDLVLPNNNVSRRHARVEHCGEGVELLDLGSTNGTIVNGRRITRELLRHGDAIEVGGVTLTFWDEERTKVLLDDSAQFRLEQAAVVRRAADSTGQLNRTSSSVTKGVVPPEPGRILPILNDFARQLLGVQRLDELLQQVLGMVFEYLPVERGSILLLDESDGSTLTPVASRQRNPQGETQMFRISRTLCRMAMSEGVAILTSDVRTDSRFGADDSIHLHDIHSAMCAPLHNEGQSIGVIHVDSPVVVKTFDGSDLDLLTALANFAAIAIERSRMQERISLEERRRRRLGRFLSPQVAARVIEASSGEHDLSDTVAPDQRVVSVLFADIVGFTSLSERIGPEGTARLLRSFLSEMTQVIFEHDGMLDKYIGDAIMAVFGAPLDMPDHAYRAVQAALAMREKLAEFNAGRVGEAPLQIRIAINSGLVVAAEIGSSHKTEYTVLGDTVNVASRLEGAVARPGMIVIGANTWESVRDQFQCQSLGLHRLKGKEVEIAAYSVQGAIDVLARN